MLRALIMILTIGSAYALSVHAGMTTFATARGPFTLHDKPVRIALHATGGSAASDLTAEVARGGRVYLVLQNLRAERPPGVVYNVFVGGDGDAVAAPATTQAVGALSFYDVTTGTAAEPPSRSYEIGAALRALHSRGALRLPLTVTIVAADPPERDATPIVGDAVLVKE